MHADAIEKKRRYLIVDDVIATGGTAAATARLVRQQGGEVVACLFCIELAFLRGRVALGDIPVHSLIAY
jgi:adenine phosphoribosyltransferase